MQQLGSVACTTLMQPHGEAYGQVYASRTCAHAVYATSFCLLQHEQLSRKSAEE